MATTYAPGAQMTNVINNAAGKTQVLNDPQTHGRVKAFVENITLASQDYDGPVQIPCARLPAGAIIHGFIFCTDTSLGSSTVSIIDAAGTPVVYTAAATLTATNTPTTRGNAAVIGQKITACYDYLGNAQVNYFDLLLSIGVADLPASGNLSITTLYSGPSS